MTLGTWASLALIALSGPALLLLASRVNAALALTSLVRQRLAYLGAALVYAIAVWLGCRLMVPGHGDVLRIGELSAPVTGLGWLGVGEADTWGTLLLTIGGIVTVVTAVTLWLQVGRPAAVRPSSLLADLPVAVVLAMLNASIEELLFRVVLIESTAPAVAAGALSATNVALVSALTFGLPHWFGYPSGPIGALLAGFLGWLACTATLQTGGIAWAWVLHVVLDIVIFNIVIAAARAPTRNQ